MARQCNARESDISEVVAAASRIVRDPKADVHEQIHAATLLVMLDLRSLLDRIESRLPRNN